MIAKTARPNTEVYNRPKFRKPARLPQSQGEQEFEYVCALKQDAPFECVHLLGLNFQKYVLPAEASLRENADKHYQPQVLCFWLTKKQVKALKERAKEVELVIPRKPNPKWRRDTTPNEQEYFASYKTMADKWIILEKKENYNPIALISQKKEVFKTETENFKEEIYKSQAKGKKK